MSYEFNPHHHVKIWISGSRDSFLNQENQLRLIRMRVTNKTDTIHFFYDGTLLSAQALKNLEKFCNKHNILAKEIHKEVLSKLTTPEEIQLKDLYLREITTLGKPGNEAAASDYLRWLHPVYQCGTYSDFDVKVDTRTLPQTIMVEKPLLFCMGSISLTNQYDSVVVCNHIIAVVDNQAAMEDIKKIQRNFYKASAKASSEDSFFNTLAKATTDTLKKINAQEQFNQNFYLASRLDCLSKIHAMALGKTAWQLRKEILQNTDNTLSFCKYIFQKNKTNYSDWSDQQLVAAIVKGYRNACYGQLIELQCEDIKNNSNAINGISSLLDEKDNDAFLKHFRAKERFKYFKEIIVHTSGPVLIKYTLFPEMIYPSKQIEQELGLFSIQKYGLDQAFWSENQFPFHSDIACVTERLKSNIGDVCDLSWLEEGKKVIQDREQKMEKAARFLQGFFREHRNPTSRGLSAGSSDLFKLMM